MEHRYNSIQFSIVLQERHKTINRNIKHLKKIKELSEQI